MFAEKVAIVTTKAKGIDNYICVNRLYIGVKSCMLGRRCGVGLPWTVWRLQLHGCALSAQIWS